jgi:hypothetical protein
MNTSDQLSVKSNSGVVSTFPTIPGVGGNTQVLFNDAGSLNGNANLIFDKTTGITTGLRLNATANITAPQLISNIATGTAPLVVTSTTTVANLAAATATTAGTVTTAAQGNITSVGTLTSLAVTGNGTFGNINTSGTETATRFISNIATGTAPLTVTSTTRVANLSVDYANVADFISVAAGTGNNFIIFANAATGNITELTSTGLIANLSNNSITATTFVGALSGAATSATTATTAGTVTTAAQGNITSVGTLTSLGVSGAVTASTLVSNVATGTAPLTVTSTTTVANLAAATAGSATTAGTVTTAAQGNITSVGTLTGLGVNGTVTAVNITANTGVFTGNANGISSVQAGNIVGTTLGATVVTSSLTTVGTLGSLTVTGNVTGGNLVTGGVLTVNGTGVSSIGGNLDMTSNTIINLATPTNGTDAATKQYVDDVAQGLNIHDSCNAATQTTLATISGGTITYNNGTAGVGATLTTTGSYTTIDGVTLADGMRILVKNEATAANNGIYVRTSATVLTRAADFNTPVEMEGGDFTFVTAGTLYDNTGWVMTDPVTTVGTSPVTWVQFSGAGAYQAGTGLTLTGTTFSVNASQTQVTSVGTLTSLGVSGAVTASTLVSNVATGTAPFTVTSTTQVANLSVATAGSATTAGTVTTAAQGNITSVGTLTSLGVSGAVTASTLVSNVATGTAPFTVTSTTQVANLSVATAGSATTAGTVTTAAQPNITSVGTLSSVAVTGNATMANVVASTYDITGVATGISAAGTTQATGTVLAKAINVVSTVLSGNGVVLPVAVAGMRITVINTSANVLAVYPAVNGIINAAAANVAYSAPAGAKLDFVSTTTTQWYTLNATYN